MIWPCKHIPTSIAVRPHILQRRYSVVLRVYELHPPAYFQSPGSRVSYICDSRTTTYPQPLATAPSTSQHPFKTNTHTTSEMTSQTPQNLLALASQLSTLSTELCTVGGKLATAAAALEQEAANVAAENAKQWGVNVHVAVRAGPWSGAEGGGSEVMVQK